jgi:hypothetical protein
VIALLLARGGRWQLVAQEQYSFAIPLDAAEHGHHQGC